MLNNGIGLGQTVLSLPLKHIVCSRTEKNPLCCTYMVQTGVSQTMGASRAHAVDMRVNLCGVEDKVSQNTTKICSKCLKLSSMTTNKVFTTLVI